MRPTVKFGSMPFAMFISLVAGLPTALQAAELLSADSIDQLAARRFWQMAAPIPADDRVSRTVLLDDNLYLLTEKNLVFAVHAKTGVIRWTAQAAEPGQTLRGPTHSGQYVFFTGPASVKVIDRATGDLASEPRTLRGVITEINHDIADISIGRAHGLRADDILDVYPIGVVEEDPARVVAQLRATEVGERHAKGRVIRSSRVIKVEPGMRLLANVKLPLLSVKLPFAATSPAIADANNISSGRPISVSIRSTFLAVFETGKPQFPKLSRPRALLVGDELYFGSQGGIVTCDTRRGKRTPARKKWEFETEGPIFYDLAADAERVYVASNDRLIYAIDRKNGRRLWFERFDNPPNAAPVVSGGRVYQTIAGQGLYCINAATGDRVWHLPEPAHYLAHFGKDCYVFAGTSYPAVVRLDAATGKVKTRESASQAQFAQASPDDQLILLANDRGTVMCMRPKTAPALQPAELAAVLQNDARARELARMTAEQRAMAQTREKPEEIKRPDIKFIDEDDLFGSQSTAKPAGGRGLVEVDEKPAKDTDDSDADSKDEDETDADSDEDESSDDADADSDEDSDEDSADSDDEDEGDEDEDSDEADSDDDSDSDDEDSGDDDEADEDDESEDEEESGDDDEDSDDDSDDEDSDDEESDDEP
ncbi:MAG: PQQ-binding-like beta-propeller repeat protein [Planctomycetes bacterium]|nr:PQQ-binding-like beta-propeller repeat protein [Planctomycetota bacterium]